MDIGSLSLSQAVEYYQNLSRADRKHHTGIFAKRVIETDVTACDPKLVRRMQTLVQKVRPLRQAIAKEGPTVQIIVPAKQTTQPEKHRSLFARLFKSEKTPQASQPMATPHIANRTIMKLYSEMLAGPLSCDENDRVEIPQAMTEVLHDPLAAWSTAITFLEKGEPFSNEPQALFDLLVLADQAGMQTLYDAALERLSLAAKMQRTSFEIYTLSFQTSHLPDSATLRHEAMMTTLEKHCYEESRALFTDFAKIHPNDTLVQAYQTLLKAFQFLAEKRFCDRYPTCLGAASRGIALKAYKQPFYDPSKVKAYAYILSNILDSKVISELITSLEVFEQICEVGNLLGPECTLESLDISVNGCECSGADVNIAANQLKMNTTLKEIHLKADPKSTQTIVDGLQNNETLRRLSLSAGKCDVNTAAAVANLVRISPNLRALDLSLTKINDVAAGTILDAVKDNDTLQTLNLAGSHMTAASLLSSAALLRSNTTLRELVTGGGLPDRKENLEEFVSALVHNKTLEEITLQFMSDYGNRTSALFNAVGEVLAGNRTLKKLVLEKKQAWGGISERGRGTISEGIKSLAKGLETNTSLETLGLNQCGLNDDEIECLAKVIEKHPSLKHLEFTGNGLAVEGANAICAAVRAQGKIFTVDLQGNAKLKDKQLDTLIRLHN